MSLEPEKKQINPYERGSFTDPGHLIGQFKYNTAIAEFLN
jgi:hypothetical protein